MCGIFAALDMDKRFGPEEYSKFTNLTYLVKYRGPDAHACYSYDSFNKIESSTAFNIFFGHNRLSIIDLTENAHQPMEISDCVIIFNGEIFNFIELRQELLNEGIKFITNSDTEVIIQLYRKYGESSFKRLNGMWAFLIFDKRKNRIVVSRDRFSEKPLFYYQDGARHYFSSEIKQILPLLNTVNFNITKILLFIHQGLLDIDDESFIKDIYHIKPKTNIIIDLNTGILTETVYWDYSNISIASNENITELFYSILSDSVKIRLRGDVEVAALVSGGLDSSALAVIAKKYSEKIKTFSIISEDKHESEEKFINILINETGLTNDKLLIRKADILSNFNHVIYHQDEPFANLIVLAHYALLEKIKKETDITVIISGQGGDEILMGYLRHYFFYLKNLLNEKNYFKFVQDIFFSLYHRTAITQFQLNKAKRYMPSLLANDKPFLYQNTQLQKTWGHVSLRKAQIQDIDKFSVPYLTRYEDRNSMANSLEIRLPFLDYRLVDLLINIPVEYKIHHGWNKYILRKSIHELPKRIKWRRDKKGFSLPEDEWLKEDLQTDIKNSFEKSILQELGIINSKKFMDYYNNFRLGSNKIHNTDISRVLITEKWAKAKINTIC